MNDMTLPGLIVPIEGRVDRLEKALKRASDMQSRQTRQWERMHKRSADNIGAGYERAGSRISSAMTALAPMAGGLAGGLLGGMAVGGVSEIAQGLAQMTRGVAELGDEAARAGMSLESFQRWKFLADQNRVSIDALVDGFKELSLRADEYIITGVGGGAEAFARLGYSADDLKAKLKNPSDLMLEIIGRMKTMDKAAQIRIFDELLGGTGGEQFVQLLARGEGELRQTLATAQEVGAVMGDEWVKRADEVSRKFAELTARISTFGKMLAVAVAEGVVDVTDLRTRLDEIFPDEAQGRAILGPLYDALAQNADLVDAQAEDLGVLSGRYQHLGEEANRAAMQMTGASVQMNSLGYTEAADQLSSAATEAMRLSDGFAAGDIPAADFAEGLAKVQAEAKAAFDQLDAADQVTFTAAISEVSRFGSVIAGVVEIARQLKAAVADATRTPTITDPNDTVPDSILQGRALAAEQAALDGFLASEAARNGKTAERLELEREIEAVKKRAAAAGVVMSDTEAEEAAAAVVAANEARKPDRATPKGGGKSDTASDFTGAVKGIKEETAILTREAAILTDTATAGRTYAQAMDFARQKADLLAAAQRDGLTITPQIMAQIDQLAAGYVKAGDSATAAADKLQQIEERGKRGAEAVASIFTGMLSGATSAGDALKGLLLRMAEVQLQKRLMNAFGGADAGNTMATIGGLLGFASGGYTGQGGKFEPAGIVHRGEYVVSKAATERLGVGNLDRLHRSALRGYSGGGLVGDTQKALAPASGASGGRRESMPMTINAPITVNGGGGTMEQNTDLARQIAREHETAMRGLIRKEMGQQMRQGGMLASRR